MPELLLLLISNILPLYVLIGLGYIAGRWLDVNLHSMAIVAIYILAPIVNFGALAQMEFTPQYILLPIIIYFCSVTIGIVSYTTAQKIWKNNRANLVGMSSVVGNTMYFGLPVVMALLGPEWAGVYALINLGIFLNEISLGYYFGARDQASVKGAILKVLKLPVIYGIALGLLYNMSGLDLPDSFMRYWNYAIGAWVFIGMMIIGVALSKLPSLDPDWGLIANLFVPKFIVWPIVGFTIILGDMGYFQLFSSEVYYLLAIITSVPLAGNLVAYAATLNLHPEKTAAAVLLSTILGILSVPGAVLLLELILR